MSAPTPQYEVADEWVKVPTLDGTRLHARLWRPDTREPLPVVINYDPYRSTDGRTIGRGDIFHWLARHGYVVCHLSVRGTDASDGIAEDEYAEVEQRDGCDAVEWFAAQPWCNGNVGMIGTSYSGFTCLQVAMHRPPALKAIVPVNATDDRYTDDVHYRGGTLHLFDNVTNYGAAMPAMNALPTLPRHRPEDWLESWVDRLERTPLWLETWLSQQVDGPYWRDASLRPGYERVTAATLLAGAWQDAYRTATLRMFRHLSCPKRCIMGPWTHSYPDFGEPGPNVDFMAMVVRWFDRWLKGIDNGVEQEPALVAYMQEHERPDPRSTSTPGFWRAEPAFPAPGTIDHVLHLDGAGRLADRAPAETGAVSYDYRATRGTATLGWGGCPWLGKADDQRADEAFSAVFTGTPLEQPLHLLGNPRVEVTLSVDAPVAHLVAKLSEVAPDGSSLLLGSGVLNLTHRDGHEAPAPLVADERYRVAVEIDALGCVVAAGHCLRLALSASDWPNTWPAPCPSTTTLHLGGDGAARLVLPSVPAKGAQDSPDLGPARMPLGRYPAHGPVPSVTVTKDVQGARTVVTVRDTATGRPDPGIEHHRNMVSTIAASDGDPAAASCETVQVFRLRFDGREVETRGRLHMQGGATTFHLAYDLTASQNGETFFRRSWRRDIPRRLV